MKKFLSLLVLCTLFSCQKDAPVVSADTAMTFDVRVETTDGVVTGRYMKQGDIEEVKRLQDAGVLAANCGPKNCGGAECVCDGLNTCTCGFPEVDFYTLDPGVTIETVHFERVKK